MPLFWLSLFFLVGIILASILSLSSLGWLLLSALALTLLLIPRLLPYLPPLLSQLLPASPVSRLSPPIPILLCVLCLGAARYQAAQPIITEGFIAWYNDSEVEMTVIGILVEPPDVRDRYVNLRIQVERLHPEGERLRDGDGLLLARVPTGDEWRYGDRVVLTGKIETPPEDETFSYRDYLARQGIYAYMPYAEAFIKESDQGRPLLAGIYALKARALETVYHLFPDPEASLLAGILLGVETGISTPVKDAFRDTGTSHIIAISGFNFTIIAGLFVRFFGRLLGRWRGAIVAMAMVILYTILVGADAAVVRAAIMSGMALFARQVGRRQTGINSLAFTGAVMALFDPQILWDIGFQLSFTATLGLVLYADPFSAAFVRLASRRLPEETVARLVGPVGEYFLFTFAAGITTLPVIVYHFRRFSIISLPANFVILPIQPPVMIVGGLAVLLGLIYLPMGQLAAYFAWPFVAFTIRAVELFAAIPGGTIALGAVSLGVVVVFYAALLLVTFATDRVKGWFARLDLGGRPAVWLSVLALLTILVWQTAFYAPDGYLRLTVLDVGTGEALLIQTPTGRTVLVNGGPSATLLSEGLGRRLPLGYRRIDYLVVAAPGENQVAALPTLIERFPPDNALWAGTFTASRSARYLREALSEAQIPIIIPEAGQVLDLGGGAKLTVLAVNRGGAVFMLEWDRFRALLPLGLDFDILETLRYGEAIGPVTALLLADNGYAPLNPPEWIANLNPWVALLSVSANDYDGLPDPETLDALEGYTLLRTDLNGWIQLMTDGVQLWVEVERR